MSEPKFKVNHCVYKLRGASFWGVVRCVYEVVPGEWRYDVMAIHPEFQGTVHIMNGNQIGEKELTPEYVGYMLEMELIEDITELPQYKQYARKHTPYEHIERLFKTAKVDTKYSKSGDEIEIEVLIRGSEYPAEEGTINGVSVDSFVISTSNPILSIAKYFKISNQEALYIVADQIKRVAQGIVNPAKSFSYVTEARNKLVKEIGEVDYQKLESIMLKCFSNMALAGANLEGEK